MLVVGLFSFYSSRSFLGQMALLTCAIWAAWQISVALMEISQEAAASLSWARLSQAMVCLIAVSIFHLLEAAIYNHDRRRQMIMAQWIICALLAPLMLFTPLGISHSEHFWWGQIGQWGVIGFVMGIWIFLLMSVATWDQWQSYRRLPSHTIERERRKDIATMAGCAYCGVLDFPAYAGFDFYQPGSLPVIAYSLMILYISRKSGWHDVGPASASRILAEKSHTALLLVDSEGLIRFSNNRAQDLFSESGGSLTFQQLNVSVDPELTVARLKKLAAADSQRPFRIQHSNASGDIVHLDTHVSDIRAGRDATSNHAYYLEFQDVSQELTYQQSLLIRDSIDPLTKLPTRSAFVTIARNYNDAGLESSSYFILTVGIAGLREINENLGYEGGDRLIGDTSRWLRETFPEALVISRMGGDEFALLLPGKDYANNPDAAQITLDRICELGKNAHPNIDYGLYAGMAAVPKSADGVGAALRNATFAMIGARNEQEPFKLYAAKERAEKVKEQRLYEALAIALDRGEFELHYQPIVNSRTRLISGFEALIRWNRPDHGLVPPGMFIELIENSALGQPVQDWIIKEATQQLHQWQQQTTRPIWVSINITQDDIRGYGLLEKLLSATQKLGVAPRHLCIEVTERMAMGPNNEGALIEIGKEGFGIAVDDFGTGYSALSRLTFLPITKLKIDRNFVSNMASGPAAQTLVRGIATLGLELQMDVVAEGVEHESELQKLDSMGVRDIQGYYFSPARPASYWNEKLNLPMEADA